MADQMPKMPPSFKAVLPFIRRAEELDRDSTRPESKLIAYFCRQYAMELGIKVRENDTSNEATEYLLALMDRLENDKNKLPAFTHDEGKEICEDFALEIFAKADDEDRAGNADKNTARTFYAAGTFFDILNQFGDISEAIVEKRRYCKYKAAMILKAIKEGRAPVPGPPEGGMDASEGGSEDSGMSFPSAPATAPAPAPAPHPDPYASTLQSPAYAPPPQAATPPSAPRAPTEFPSFTQTAGTIGASPTSSVPPAANNWQQPPAPAPVAAPVPQYTPPPVPAHQHAPHVPPSAPVVPSVPPQVPPSYASPQAPPAGHARNGPVSQNEINDAIECAKFAIAALKVKDLELAAQRLEMALRSIR
uniref:Vta1/callose synthase N-terminal domain-containing protein n=1 Tax=Globisporangium ultimum (strain ATCC 200006 / CBS 805.95 / DAOM BR144) TaxID=431595 RepID=K3WPP5_GLOUD